jgi:hypothetical protein
VNRSLAAGVVLLLSLAGCAGVQRVPLQHEVRRIPDGRFIGPLEIPVPRRAEHDGHDFEIHVRLRARCAPQLTLAFPDGETETIGVNDRRWQELLALRAKVAESVEPGSSRGPSPAPAAEPAVHPESSRGVSPEPAAEPAVHPESSRGVSPEPAPQPAPYVPPSSAAVGVDAELRIPAPPPSGHWATTRTDSWPGQLEFEAARRLRCASGEEFHTKYLNAFDETGTIALWAEVPQELLGAELEYEIIELVTAKPPEVHAAAVEVHVEPPRPPKEQPPMPGPKEERPAPPEDPTAKWQPGHWVWVEGDGRWVWHDGYWLTPPRAPALKAESPGAAPNPGCTWVNGYWTWEPWSGHWVWQGGHWNAPPPKQEERGTPPGEGAPWNAGYWTAGNGRFVWIAGHWGKPTLRAEIAEQGCPSTQWIAGDWISVRGTWVWSAGFCQGAQRPPPLKSEDPGAPPAPGAVWLQGFWRWDAGIGQHVWVGGHWELPPGEGYVWIQDPPSGGLILRGHWELKVKVR